MKRLALSAIVALSAAGTLAADGGSLEDAIRGGKFSADMQLFYMVRDFDDPAKTDAKALTFGGIVKYQSGVYEGFDFAFAYYGSHRVGGFFSREEGIGTSLLQPDGEDIAFLGEAYLEYRNDAFGAKVGRQRLSTPLMNDHYLRLLPSVYEAAKLFGTLGNTYLEGGYVQAYSGFGSKYSGFEDMEEKWGEDGLGYVYLKDKSIENLTFRAQYIWAISDTASTGEPISVLDYRYADIAYALPWGTKSYIKAQYGGNDYNDADDSSMYGVKVGTRAVDWLDVALLWNKIEDNNFKAVEAGPMYSDWQQGYGPYEPSSAVGGQMIFYPVENSKIKLGYVEVDSDTPLLIDDYSEFNLDAWYHFNDWNKIRVRYSIKDQSDESEALYYDDDPDNGGREDRTDFRIIYYISF